MIKSLLRAIDSGSSISQFKITLLDCLLMLKKAWEAVTPSTIANCFRKGGFEVCSQLSDDPFADSDDEESSESDPLSRFSFNESKSCSFQEYVGVDENLQCSPMLTTEEIVSSIASSDTVDEDDTGEPLAVVTHKQACEAYQQLRSYLLRHSSDHDCPYSMLDALEAKLNAIGNTTHVQSLITDFVHVS